jgi:hypothetical protein
VEVVVALTIGALLTLLAHQVFAAVVDGAREVRSARHRLDREVNGRRLLASALLSLDVRPDAGPFEGHPDRMEFDSWLLTPDGWFERASIRLDVHAGQLIYTPDSAPPVVLADSVTNLGLDYLLEPGAAAHWVGEWVSPVSAPLAVRVRLSRVLPGGQEVSDTALYLIKARG